MKTVFSVILLIFCLSTISFGQTIRNARSANKKIQSSKVLSAKFKSVAGPVLRADDDCKPPPCTGIIDPWTCECFPDIKDPWEEKSMAKRMEQFIMFETLIARGEGKSLYPETMVTLARKKYPGKSMRAIVKRLNYYIAQSR